MKTERSHQSLLRVLERLYRAALRSYPVGFRRAHGREMTEAFRDSCHQVRRRGRVRLLAHGCHALGELLLQGVLERLLLLRRAVVERRRGHFGAAGDGFRDRPGLGRILESIVCDFRLALRGLWKNPGFTVTSGVVLALGIGANTAIFSVVNGVLLRPLPYPDPDELVNVWQINQEWLDSPDPRFREMGAEYPASFPVLQDWVELADAFQAVGGFQVGRGTLDFGNRVERIRGSFVTSGVFAALGVPPLIGRAIVEEDDGIGADRVAVISHGFWQSHYGGDASVLGGTVDLNGETLTVVGVMPEGFYFPDSDCQLWGTFSDSDKSRNRGTRFLRTVARLRPGLALDAAQEEMEAMNQRVVEATGGEHRFGVRLNSRVSQVVGDVRLILFVLLGVVAVVLLIACANIASLQLIRATSRRRDLAVRSAMGAGRGRLLRQLLVESLTLGVISGLLGLAIAMAMFEPMLTWLPEGLPRLDEVALDYRVLSFCAGISLFTALLVGVLPGLNTSSMAFAEVLKEGGRSHTGDVRRRRMQGALVTAEIALAFVLLIGSGLLLKSFVVLSTVERGFDPTNVLTLAVALPEEEYRDAGPRATFVQLLQERVSALPGVRNVALSSDVPFVGGAGSMTMTIENRDGPHEVDLQVNRVTPDYFQVLGIPLLGGRTFRATDGPEMERVAIINAAAAREHWPGEDPVGKRLRAGGLDDPGEWRIVVGVVGDTRLRLDREARPRYYLPLTQWLDASPMVSVKTAAEPESLIDAVRSAVLAVEPKVPIPTAFTLEDRIARSVATPRLHTMLVTGLAGLAGLLALLGVYGVLSYAIAQRTGEIGIRMALGARGPDVRRDVLWRGAGLAGLGLAIGLGIALGAVRTLRSLLFQTEIYDVRVFLGAAILLGVAALAASYVPALRATRVDPVEALRSE